MTVTQEELKSLLHYDPATGIFTWKITSGKAITGKKAGCKSAVGYWYIRYKGKSYLCSRLAYLYMTGKFPSSDEEMDHIDRDRLNDKWDNLRCVSRSVNNHNKAFNNKGDKGLPLGVYACKQTPKYRAKCKINKKQIHIGYYDTPEMAHQAYMSYIQNNVDDVALRSRLMGNA